MKTAFKHTIFTYLTLGLLSLIFFNISIFNFIEDAFDDFSYLDLIQSTKISVNLKLLIFRLFLLINITA